MRFMSKSILTAREYCIVHCFVVRDSVSIASKSESTPGNTEQLVELLLRQNVVSERPKTAKANVSAMRGPTR